MSLIGALNIGKSALAVHQAAIQVTSNNVANAGNPEYTRQVARVKPNPDYPLRPGIFVGTGVNLASVERQIDAALEERIRGSVSDSESSSARQQWLGRVEAIFNELGDDDLSTRLSKFFNSWSALANTPMDNSQRQLVVQNGQGLADMMRDLHAQLETLGGDIDKRLGAMASDANVLADKVAELNSRIVTAEGGSGATANTLRDQRDSILKRLSELVDIKTQESPEGAVTVCIGSEPLVIGSTNRGIVLKREGGGSSVTVRLVIKADNTTIDVSSGQMGALMGLRGEIGGVSDELDKVAGNLIFEVNHLHSQGQGLEGFAQVTGGNAVNDAAAALNSDGAGLKYRPVNGSFLVQVRRKSDGGVVSGEMVHVDLDGIGVDDSLNSLAAKLDAVNGVSASVVGGKLKIEAENQSDTEITFSEDHSYALASLGVNCYFTGTGAADIAVNATLKTNPALVAAAANGQKGDNQTARAIAGLQSQGLGGLGNASLNDSYEAIVSGVAVAVSGVKTSAEASQVILETLTTQREALSGVSLDEEAVNLMREQRAFQAAARIISTVDEMMQTLLELV